MPSSPGKRFVVVFALFALALAGGCSEPTPPTEAGNSSPSASPAQPAPPTASTDRPPSKPQTSSASAPNVPVAAPKIQTGVNKQTTHTFGDVELTTTVVDNATVTGHVPAAVDETRTEIVILARATSPVPVVANLHAPKVRGLDSDKPLATIRARLGPDNKHLVFTLAQARLRRFPPGKYRLELSMEGAEPHSMDLFVAPEGPPAELLTATNAPTGFNLASASLGGTVTCSSEHGRKSWHPDHLIDGYRRVYTDDGGTVSAGWMSGARDATPQCTFSLSGNRPAKIHAVVLSPAIRDRETEGYQSPKKTTTAPRLVEVWASTTSATSGFSRVARARLANDTRAQQIAFDPVEAGFVQVRLLSNYGEKQSALSEVRIHEAEGPSVLAGEHHNLALLTNGGAVRMFTSQTEDNPAWQLIDGTVGPESGWSSERVKSGPAPLPQTLIIGFRNNEKALIDRIVIDPTGTPKYATGAFRDRWAKRIAISVSDSLAMHEFEELSVVTLRQAEEPQTFPIGRKARFVKLHVLENHGGAATSIGEVEVIEGTEPGYVPVLARADRATHIGGALEPIALSLPKATASESESNDSVVQSNALALETILGGTIDPQDDHDVFAVAVPGSKPAMLSVERWGLPGFQPSMSLRTPDGETLSTVGPAVTTRSSHSWSVKPGTHHLTVQRTDRSTVLVLDTSGSMAGKLELLAAAVEQYLDQLGPDEQVMLLRFSDTIDIPIPKFTWDREQLQKALRTNLHADGGTAFVDAVNAGLDQLRSAPGSKAIIAFTDGQDTRSRKDVGQLWQRLAGEHVPIYAIGLGGDLDHFNRGTASSGELMLGTLAAATSGRFVYAADSSVLADVYKQIAAHINQPPVYRVRATVPTSRGTLVAKATAEHIPALDPPRLLIILDASGSMRRRIDGTSMMESAKSAVSDLLGKVPSDVELGVRVFGNKVSEGKPGACNDTTLLAPVAKGGRRAVRAAVARVRARGTTLISATLRAAAEDLGRGTGDRTIVLITDGEEECGGDPAEAVKELAEQGYNLRLNIVGFSLTDPKQRTYLQSLAQANRGIYFDADDGARLREAVSSALNASFRVLDSADRVVADGVVGGPALALAPATYRVEVLTHSVPLPVENVSIVAGQETLLELRKEGEHVGVNLTNPKQPQ